MPTNQRPHEICAPSSQVHWYCIVSHRIVSYRIVRVVVKAFGTSFHRSTTHLIQLNQDTQCTGYPCHKVLRFTSRRKISFKRHHLPHRSLRNHLQHEKKSELYIVHGTLYSMTQKTRERGAITCTNRNHSWVAHEPAGYGNVMV